jgi:hypothetical protein
MGHGGMLEHWVHSPSKGPYQSFGNGGAMRVRRLARKVFGGG